MSYNNSAPEENGEVGALRNRVQELERRVGEQDTELNNLKTQLADCIKRVAAVETRSPAASKANSHATAPKKPPESAPATARPTHSTASSNDHPPAASSIKKPASAAAAAAKKEEKPEKKEEKPKDKAAAHPPPSARDRPRTASAKTAGAATSAGDKAGAAKSGEKEPVVNKEEGSVKMWLRGRPLLFYGPTPGSDEALALEASHAKEQPAQKLKLNWVYGFRGKDCRTNVLQLPTKELVYFVAATVVLYNPAAKTQRHYLGHTDDVKCIALHPDKITVATGQVAGHDKTTGKAHVRVWNSMNLNTLAVLGSGVFERAISCLAFSRLDNGALLAVHDEGNEHSLYVWDWQKSKKVAESKASGDQILSLEWSTQEAGQLASVGKVGVLFWFFDAGAGSLAKKQGIFEKFDKPKCVLCSTYTENGDLLTGDTNSSLFLWPRGQQKISSAAATRPHEGGLFALALFKDAAGNSRILSGGKDRKIAIWDSNLAVLSNVTIGEQFGAIRTLTPTSEGELFVGTAKNYILSGKTEQTTAEEFQVLVSGHSDELWGLAVHPQRHQFLTCCYDKTLILWDSLTHSEIWTKEINDPAHSAAFHPSGEVVAVGTKSARWLVVELATRETLASHTDGNEQIECLEYSPDGNYLALGSRDNFIYVYQVAENGRKYTKIGRCSGHSSFVTHIDWSLDSQTLQSNSGDYEHLFWTAATCKQVTSSITMRDVKWATSFCPFAYSTFGIWPEGSDGTDINSCSRANAVPVIASADDFGKVNLYYYPSHVPRAAHTEYGGHSSHVTNVRFLFDDSRLISTGGKDMGVFEWELQT